MIEKRKFINLMSLALAALVTVAIIIACGKGDPENIEGDIEREIELSKTFLKGNMKNPDFMSSVTAYPSSSSKAVSSSSGKGGNSSNGNTSGSSSSNAQGGSSSDANQGSSSSGESSYILTCEITGTGTAGKKVDLSEVTKVKCVAKSSPNTAINLDPDNFTWSYEPELNERSPVAGEYSIEVEVDESANACQGLKADCSGTFTVNAVVSSSSSKPSSSSVAASSSSVASSSSRASSSSVAASSSSRASSSSTPPATSSSSSAPPTTYTATCTWAAGGTTMYTGQTRPADPTITCTPTATGSASSGLPPTGNLATAATYTPSGIRCGTATPTNTVSCGTLTVKTAPTVACAGKAEPSLVSPEKPTKPTVTLTDPSNICSAANSTAPNASWTAETWTVSKNGTALTANAIWANIFDGSAGTYNNYKVTGKCGDYATNLTATCSPGSATVAAAQSCKYQTTYCDGMEKSQITKVASLTQEQNSTNTKYCYFLTTITDNKQGAQINGNNTANDVKCCNDCGWGLKTCSEANLPAKVDGGYYVYVPGYSHKPAGTNSYDPPNLHPDCR